MCAAKTLCFYYPTTVVIVDDNQAFLENLPDNLSGDATYKLFSSATEALKFLKSKKANLPTPEDFLGLFDDPITGTPLNVDIAKIQILLQNNHRFETPTVVIVDHDMPGMSGLEFCKKISDYPIKKVMLTGAADHKLAIEAFNEGIIQKFITKEDAQVFAAIDHAIHALQQEYFAHLSEHIVKSITAATFSFLNNKEFQKFFWNFVKENHITEFYLTDAVGSFMMRNNQGALLRLVVQSNQEIENYCQTAKDHDAPAEIITALESKKKLLCLLSEKDFQQPVAKWQAYLHTAQKIRGIDDGYFAVIYFTDPII